MSPAVTLGFAEATAVMILMGYFAIELLIGLKALSRWLVWSLSPGVGAGICSLIGFLFRRPMFTIERLLLILLFIAWLWRRGTRLPSFSQLATAKIPLLGASFAVGVALVLLLSVQRIGHQPHGGFDGFSIWNSHSRYLYRDGPHWQEHIKNTFHPDYPLLVPLSVARLWRYAGTEVPDIGGLFGIMFSFSVVSLLGAAMAMSRGSCLGLFAAITLLTTPDYMVQGTGQEADVPLSYFVLGATALVYLYFENETVGRKLLVLAGFMAGCAGSTKNEGLLFLAAMFAVLIIPVVWDRAALRRAGLFLIGCLVPLAVVLYFKLAIAPPTDLFANRHYAEFIEKVFTLDRHAITFGNFLSWGWTFGGWTIHPLIFLPAFLVWRGTDKRTVRSFGWRTCAASLAIVLVGYYTIYIITPMGLIWHLENSLLRLMMHLWPSVILLVGLCVPGETEPTA